MRRIIILMLTMVMTLGAMAQSTMEKRHQLIKSYGQQFTVSRNGNWENIQLSHSPYPCVQYFMAINNQTNEHRVFLMAKYVSKTPTKIKYMEIFVNGKKYSKLTVSSLATQRSTKVGNLYRNVYQELAHPEMLKNMIQAKTCYVKFVSTTGKTWVVAVNTNEVRLTFMLFLDLESLDDAN